MMASFVMEIPPGSRCTHSGIVRAVNRGVPIIGSADVSATDMAFFTNTGSIQNNRRTNIATSVYRAAIVCK